MSTSMSFQDKTVYSRVSNPEPEPEFVGKEGKDYFKKSVIYILIDLILTILLIFEEYGLIQSKDELQLNKLVLISIIAIIIFLIILILIISHITYLVIIAKYAYILLGSIYYSYKLVLKIILLINNEANLSNLDLLFFVITLASIVPRIIGFCNIEQLEGVCRKVDNSRRILAHEKFVEKIGDRVDRGGNIGWSQTLIERTSTANKVEEKNNK
jgi:hypothetical protein